MATRAVAHVLLAAGSLLLAVELYRDPRSALLTMAIFGSVWIVRRRLVHRHHRHSTRLYRLRRELVTTAVLTMLLVTLVSVLFATLDVSADFLSGPSTLPAGVASDSQTPWAATFLLDGFLTVVAVAWTSLGALATFRRAARQHPTPPASPLAG